MDLVSIKVALDTSAAARYLEFLKSKIIGDWQSSAICYFDFKAYWESAALIRCAVKTEDISLNQNLAKCRGAKLQHKPAVTHNTANQPHGHAIALLRIPAKKPGFSRAFAVYLIPCSSVQSTDTDCISAYRYTACAFYRLYGRSPARNPLPRI